MISSHSPSVKIQMMSGKVCLGCKGKTLFFHCQQTFENKKFVDITQQCLALLPQVNFPAINMNFHRRWRWWDQIQASFDYDFFFFTLEIKCIWIRLSLFSKAKCFIILRQFGNSVHCASVGARKLQVANFNWRFFCTLNN